MSTSTAAGVETLPPAARKHLEALRSGLEKALGDNLASLLVYGSAVRGGYDEDTSDIDVIVVLKDTGLDKLMACSNPLLLARHRGRVEAMILKLDNISRAADVFPLLYDDVRGRHVVLSGIDPFAGVEISDTHRRLRIEQELREARIRMRRAVVDAMGSEVLLAGAIDRKVKQIRSPLHALLRLRGLACDDTLEAVFRETGRAYGTDTAPLLRVRDDVALAHTAFRAVLDAAIEDVDKLAVGGAA